MEATVTLADRMRAAVAIVDDVAAEVIHIAESADGPWQPEPLWLQRAGERLSADPGYEKITGYAGTVASNGPGRTGPRPRIAPRSGTPHGSPPTTSTTTK